MPNDEVTTRISIEGAQQVRADLDAIGAAEAKLAQGQAQSVAAVKAAAQAAREQATAYGSLRSQLGELLLVQMREEALGMGDSANARVRVLEIERITQAIEDQRRAEENVDAFLRSRQKTSVDAVASTGAMQNLMGGIGSQIESIALRWFSFAAVVQQVNAWMQGIKESAQATAAAITGDMPVTRQLAANVGAKEAGAVKAEATKAAQKYSFDVAGRRSLMEGYGALSDLQNMKNVTPEEREDYMRELAQFQKATGVGGGQAAKAIFQYQRATHGTFGQAASAVAGMLNEGVDVGLAQQLTSRAGMKGGVEMIGQLIGAMKEGMPDDVARGIPSFMDALNKRDEHGRIDRDLYGVGIRDETPMTDRLSMIEAARASGEISQGKYETMIGGAQMSRISIPLNKALASGRAAEGIGMLRSASNATDAIQEIDQTPESQFQDRMNQIALDEQLKLEESRSNQDAAIRQRNMQKTLLTNPGLHALPMSDSLAPIGAFVGQKFEDAKTSVTNIFNIHSMYNAPDPTTHVAPRDDLMP